MPILKVKTLESLTPSKLAAYSAANDGKTQRFPDGENLYGVPRVLKDGRVSVLFRWRFRHGGKVHDFTCGTWPAVSLADIRRARDDAERLAATGVNPNDDSKAQRLAAQKAVLDEAEAVRAALAQAAADVDAQRTVQSVFDVWVETELKDRADAGAEVRRAWAKDVLPVIGTTAVKAVTTAQIRQVADAIKARGADRLARRTFSELRQFFAYCFRREIVDADPTARIQKAKEFKKDVERDRVLDQKELKQLAAALPEAGLKDATRLSIWLMLSTLCRVGELSKARWANVDMNSARWKIPAADSKNGKEHLVYLSDFAVEQFKALKAISGHRDFCFPSDAEETHIDTKALGKQIRDRQRVTPLKGRSANCDGLLIGDAAWTPHDLRRSGATLMGELGVSGDVIEKCLNHTEENGLRRIYQRHKSEAEQQGAWALLGKRLAVLSVPGSNVLPMKTKAKAV